ncbi:MAG: peptidase M23, partial [Xanthomonadales bacterium]|nr:peptidase M23 [Xanthomonadales bacterium]NIX13907.1 peptidase M23 [Xanthomonadales bacterium]
MALFAVTLIVFGIAMGGLRPSAESPAPDFSAVLELDLPARPGMPAAEARTAPPQGMPEEEEDSWETVTVRQGQSLDAIFRAQGFSIGLLHEILALNDETRSLKKIRPGDEFAFRRNADGTLEQMRYPLDEGRYLFVDNRDGAPRAETLERLLSTRMYEAEGSIESSLFLAGKAAGLSDAMIMKLANIFGWDIDFVLDIRAGDRFYLLYEKVYRDGDYLRDGEILAATFVNQGQKFQAIRFEADNGPQYYAPDGRH